MFSNKSRTVRINHSSSAPQPTPFSLAPRALLAGSLTLLLVACAPAAVSNGSGGNSGGGKGGAAGNGNGGSNNGGAAGNGTGGSNNGNTTSCDAVELSRRRWLLEI